MLTKRKGCLILFPGVKTGLDSQGFLAVVHLVQLESSPYRLCLQCCCRAVKNAARKHVPVLHMANPGMRQRTGSEDAPAAFHFLWFASHCGRLGKSRAGMEVGGAGARDILLMTCSIPESTIETVETDRLTEENRNKDT